MPYREDTLANDEIYHVFTKSIAGYRVFNTNTDYERMIKTLSFYTVETPPCRFSWFMEQEENHVAQKQSTPGTTDRLVTIFAYCLMPTHVHLILKQLSDNGTSRYMSRVFNSYSKYFNVKHNRKGPLWESRFRHVQVKDEEQFLHLTRYVHLNPVSSGLVNKPQKWKFSSYGQYIKAGDTSFCACEFEGLLDMRAADYRKFVEERIEDKRELEKIKHLILDE